MVASRASVPVCTENARVRYQLLDRVLHPLKLFAEQNATLRVLRGELQTSERYLVVIPGQRAVFEQQLGMVLRLICVTCQDTPVEALPAAFGSPKIRTPVPGSHHSFGQADG